MKQTSSIESGSFGFLLLDEIKSDALNLNLTVTV